MPAFKARSSTARVIFDGQSLNWYPLAPARNYPIQVMNDYTFAGVPWHNSAVSGSSWTTLYRTDEYRVHPYATRAGWSILVMCGGTTDVGSELDPPATVYADMESYADAARAAG